MDVFSEALDIPLCDDSEQERIPAWKESEVSAGTTRAPSQAFAAEPRLAANSEIECIDTDDETIRQEACIDLDTTYVTTEKKVSCEKDEARSQELPSPACGCKRKAPPKDILRLTRGTACFFGGDLRVRQW